MRKALAIALLPLTAIAPCASAEIPEAEWEALKSQFAAMAARVSALEEENRKLRATANSAIRVEELDSEVAALQTRGEDSAWAERVRWKGDFRFRHEEIDEQGRDERERDRIRARAALIAQATDATEVGFGLATGGEDPVSSNQTLGGGGSKKDINLDLAYASWTGLEGLRVTGGKFANPLYISQGSQLIWDSDYRPEGVTLGWAGDGLFANALYSFIESDTSVDDETFWGLQVGTTFALAEAVTLTAAAKYLDIPSRGRPAFDVDDPDFFGNSSEVVDGQAVYRYDYELMNASLDLGFTLLDLPVNLFADYVENNDADEFNTGYLAGISLGSAKHKGGWQLLYNYEDLEADATFGAVTDSDFAGGGTDGEGHRLTGQYALDDKWYLGATYLDSIRGKDTGDDVDYDRLQLDMGWKY